jgi:hypothetical protein
MNSMEAPDLVDRLDSPFRYSLISHKMSFGRARLSTGHLCANIAEHRYSPYLAIRESENA